MPVPTEIKPPLKLPPPTRLRPQSVRTWSPIFADWRATRRIIASRSTAQRVHRQHRLQGRQKGWPGNPFVAVSLLVSKDFHIEDRERGRIVAAGVIDENGRVIWEETEASVADELSALAAEVEEHFAAGYSGGQLRPPLEWFVPFKGGGQSQG